MESHRKKPRRARRVTTVRRRVIAEKKSHDSEKRVTPMKKNDCSERKRVTREKPVRRRVIALRRRVTGVITCTKVIIESTITKCTSSQNATVQADVKQADTTVNPKSEGYATQFLLDWSPKVGKTRKQNETSISFGRRAARNLRKSDSNKRSRNSDGAPTDKPVQSEPQ